MSLGPVRGFYFMEGWIYLHRKIQENEFWGKEPFDRIHAWIDLLFLANFKRSSFFIRGNEVVVERGQLACSTRKLAERWGWSKNKVERYLKLLETRSQISLQKSSLINKIIITNYDRYQQTSLQTSPQKVHRKSNKKEGISKVNERNEDSYRVLDRQDGHSLLIESFDRFWDSYPRKVAKGNALKSWKKLNPPAELIEKILSHLDSMKDSDQWTSDHGQFIPHPTTYLNQQRWEGDLPRPRAIHINLDAIT
jgi:hypothetical protein